ncbi:MAG: HNH endonuclease [Burkholderiales bacterium]|nr:HNH endonuclease [Burkholderiales bacterium]
MPVQPWTKDQLKLAFHLYFQLPFGKLHQRNPEIIELASLIGRTPGAVAMKLSNIASLDPKITGTGRKGLSGSSELDRQVWTEFHENWEKLASESERLRKKLGGSTSLQIENDDLDDLSGHYSGETRSRMVEQRIKQALFRRVVLSGYGEKCCMSGLSERGLLVASHIVPWGKDKQNRLNPSNGLCLSAIHDRAFDRGLITVSDDFKVIVSEKLRRKGGRFLKDAILSLHKKEITLPDRFRPKAEFLAWHRDHWFVDNRGS